MKSRILVHTVVIGAALSAAHMAVAQSPIIYPSKGQSAEQQSTDTAACRQWAQQNTGVDPVAIAEAQASAPTPSTAPQGERVRGAARGAVGGAVIGEIASGDAKKGAGVGAAAGTMSGGARQRRTQSAAAQATEAQKQQASAQLARYRQAFAACMEGRGYAIK